jgi:hypothetical protein
MRANTLKVERRYKTSSKSLKIGEHFLSKLILEKKILYELLFLRIDSYFCDSSSTSSSSTDG